MRQQLRLRVLLPVAVLGLLGAGYGAFAYGGGSEPAPLPPPPTTTAAPTTSTAPTTTETIPAPQPKPARSPLERLLRVHRVVVVVFHTPGADVDSAAVREARTGAATVGAGFLAVSVASNRAVSELALKYDIVQAPAVVVVVRSGEAAAQFGGYTDRKAVAQAVTDALR